MGMAVGDIIIPVTRAAIITGGDLLATVMAMVITMAITICLPVIPIMRIHAVMAMVTSVMGTVMAMETVTVTAMATIIVTAVVMVMAVTVTTNHAHYGYRHQTLTLHTQLTSR